ncbi:MAG: hypothetical protein OXH54_05850 [Acidimicrobiaceae bacterium]|nr:hypothetical protein [Acidimicrobiaceae bacterium]
MTATAPNPAAEAAPMAHTPDMRPDPPAEAAAAAEPAAARARTRRWAIVGDSPLLTVLATAAAALLTALCAVAVALLILTLNSINNRLDRLEDAMADGFAAQNVKIDELDAKIDEVDRRLSAQIAELDRKLTAKIDEVYRRLSAQIAELDRRLTALIAGLNMTDEVDAALEGRLLDSEPAAAGPGGAPG